MLLGHLIALISNAHQKKPELPALWTAQTAYPAPSRLVNTAYRKTSFHRDKPGRSSAVSSSDPICVAFTCRTRSGYDQVQHNHPRTAQTLPSALQAYPFFTMSIKPPDFGLAETFVSSRFGLRICCVLRDRGLVEPDGIEPTTSCLQSRRSPN